MKNIEEIKKIISDHKEELKQEYATVEIGIFGSCSRGEQTSISDIDVLVDFSRSPDLLKFIELERKLEQLLGCKVDLVRKPAVRGELKSIILSEVIRI